MRTIRELAPAGIARAASVTIEVGMLKQIIA